MITTLLLTGFPDTLFQSGRVTGKSVNAYVVVSFFCFGASFFLLGHGVMLSGDSILRFFPWWQRLF